MSLRLFASIPVPPGITKDVVRLQKGVSGARWRPPEALHITVGFFGEVEDARAEDLDREIAARPLPAFALRLRGAGHYGNNPPHSLWLGVGDSAELRELHRHVRHASRRAGVVIDPKPFRPHLTVAYLRDTVDIARVISFEQRLADYQGEAFWVDEFQLWSSHRRKSGPNLYRVEATYPLLGS